MRKKWGGNHNQVTGGAVAISEQTKHKWRVTEGGNKGGRSDATTYVKMYEKQSEEEEEVVRCTSWRQEGVDGATGRSFSSCDEAFFKGGDDAFVLINLSNDSWRRGRGRGSSSSSSSTREDSSGTICLINFFLLLRCPRRLLQTFPQKTQRYF